MLLELGMVVTLVVGSKCERVQNDFRGAIVPCSVFWLHRCSQMVTVSEFYTHDTCSPQYVYYTSIKKIKHSKTQKNLSKKSVISL